MVLRARGARIAERTQGRRAGMGAAIRALSTAAGDAPRSSQWALREAFSE